MSAKPSSGRPPGFLVVGVDGSAGAVHALRWAAGVAARSGERLVVIHAFEYLPPATVSSLGWTVRDRPRQLAAARRELTFCLSGVFGSAAAGEGSWTVDGLTVQGELQKGSAGAVLCAAATGASQLVVGARGRSLAAGLLLGSVSQHVAAHAPCPVTVVRELGQERRPAPEPRSGHDPVGVDAELRSGRRDG